MLTNFDHLLHYDHFVYQLMKVYQTKLQASLSIYSAHFNTHFTAMYGNLLVYSR